MALVALMALGSVVMWIGVPVGLIFVASRLSDTSNPSMGPYVLVLVGLPVGMALVGKVLGWLNGVHARLTGAVTDAYRPAWTRSLRGERTVNRRGGVLDRVMIVSVAVAALAFAVWFFGFAGSPMPTG